jgi:putative ABC transport system ATP-binding protein
MVTDRTKETDTAVELKGVYKNFRHGTKNIKVLDGISLKVKKQQFCMLTGPSGSGKSTTLNIMSGLLRPSRGTVKLNDREIWNYSEEQLSFFRRKNTGIVFQAFNLIPDVTALDNVAMPLEFMGVDRKIRIKKAVSIMEKLGLSEMCSHYPRNMSGGEQQRIAIARALVTNPNMIFADEPTGNLDTKNSEEVMEIFKKLVEDEGKTVIMVTHNREHLIYADQVVHVVDGKVRDEDERR